ncbi:hypothetical protein J7399_14675 [Shimia sp. R9_1]|uniref:hypothetical protein n=1 Tax=Shimia sp. R9_1 TaxID=2821111 RepID=UPI001ADBB725|nr:hypothetical protein [Shimia sp. R9_1]MBO9408678.1 hypothetical protein [Shimia sp. R9_1]
MNSLSAIVASISALSLMACQSSSTQSASTQAANLLAVVETQNGCSIPLNETREVFTAAGFNSAQERIDLIWRLRTQSGALSISERQLHANTQDCGNPSSILVASEQRFHNVQKFFLERSCITTNKQIVNHFSSTDIGPYEFRSYVEVLLAAGALEEDQGQITRKDWNGCE